MQLEGERKHACRVASGGFLTRARPQVYCDNYLDGGYHIPHLHLGLNSELEMQSYRTLLFDRVSLQKCKSKSKRVGSDASYVFM